MALEGLGLGKPPYVIIQVSTCPMALTRIIRYSRMLKKVHFL